MSKFGRMDDDGAREKMKQLQDQLAVRLMDVRSGTSLDASLVAETIRLMIDHATREPYFSIGRSP